MKKLWCVLALALLSGIHLDAQVPIPVPMTPGQYAATQVTNSIALFASAIGEMSTASRKVETEVAEARRQQWESGDTAIFTKRFSDALLQKDLHFVVVRMIQSGTGQDALLKIARNASGMDRVDNGISEYCYAEFEKWADTLINSINSKTSKEQALERAEKEYAVYREKRDIAERLFFDPAGVLRSETPVAQDYLAAWLLAMKYAQTAESATAAADKIRGSLGEARTGEMASLLRSWSTVISTVTGPWGYSAETIVPFLVEGKPLEPSANWSANELRFLELRGRLLHPKVNEAPALESIQTLWNTGRSTRDWDSLRRAVAERDALYTRVELRIKNDIDLFQSERITIDMVRNNLGFLDEGFQAADYTLLLKKQPNPRAAMVQYMRRQYLTITGKLGPRQAQEMPASALVVATPPPSTTPNPNLPSNDNLKEPLNRAIRIAQDTNPAPGSTTSLAQRLVLVAKDWRNGDRRSYYEKAIADLQKLAAEFRQPLPPRLTAAQVATQTRIREMMIPELDASLSSMQKTLAAMKQ